MRQGLALVVAALSLAACFGPDPNLTEGGLAKPFVTADFPATIEAGETAELTLTVENPGPGDMNSFTVAFGAVAQGGGEGNARPLVVPAPAPERLGGEQEISASFGTIEPRPLTVGEGGALFRFGPLPEEESASVTFEIIAPDDPGSYANSLQAYDSQVIDRIDAVKLETEVTG